MIEDDSNTGGEVFAEPATPEALLRYVDASGPTDRVFALGENTLIGRYDPAVCAVDVDLTDFPDSRFASRRHARIRRENDRWLLSDMGSANGTFLHRGSAEPVRVEEELEIADGDEVLFAGIRFRFEMAVSAGETVADTLEQGQPPSEPQE